MKSSPSARRTNANRVRPQKEPAESLRECLALDDPTDCLLEAYDCVARRAYEKFLERGGQPGYELDDWVRAERELLPSLAAHISESDAFTYALVSVPGATAAAISVGVEAHWLVILARAKPQSSAPARSFCVVELPSEVDPVHTAVVLANGLLAIRMPRVVLM
ncbi:MAG: DUF2934 domain-containing protein [Candidatus Acidiferrales bacterium]